MDCEVMVGTVELRKQNGKVSISGDLFRYIASKMIDDEVMELSIVAIVKSRYYVPSGDDE